MKEPFKITFLRLNYQIITNQYEFAFLKLNKLFPTRNMLVQVKEITHSDQYILPLKIPSQSKTSLANIYTQWNFPDLVKAKGILGCLSENISDIFYPNFWQSHLTSVDINFVIMQRRDIVLQ